MSAHPNLADPDFEPTDDQLRELARAAFAHLADARRESDEKLRRQIAELRERALDSLKLPLKRLTDCIGGRCVALPNDGGR